MTKFSDEDLSETKGTNEVSEDGPNRVGTNEGNRAQAKVATKSLNTVETVGLAKPS